ncbi:MAG: hypothetical protein ACJ796_07825 [Gemmatimonadaceae bacterium]
MADAKNVFIVGNDLPPNDQPVRVGETLTTWREGYGPIGRPASGTEFVFVSPKATLDQTGRLHVLWAEPATHEQIIPPYQWILLQTSSIWSAVHDPQHGWSPPTRVYSGPIDWNWRVTSGPITEGTDGERLIAVPKEDGGVLVLALRNGDWNVTSIPGGVPAYVSILAVGARHLLAVVEADTTQAHDRNSVFLYSQEGDRAWRAVRRLQLSGTQAAMEIRLLNGAHGRVHLLWRQMIHDGYFVIRHVQSDDGGDSWTQPSDLLPGGAIQNVDAAVDTCGRVHVTFEDWSAGSFNAVRIGYATWDESWSGPQALLPSYIGTDLTLVPRVDGSMALAFYGAEGKPNGSADWAMMYSELR